MGYHCPPNLCCNRYEDRLKYIHSIVEKKLRSSFEDFTQSVMQPLDSVHTAALDTVTATFSKARPLLPASSHSLPSQPKPSLMPTPSATPSLPRLQQSVLSPSSVPSGSHSPDVRKGSPRVTSLLKLPGRAMEQLERTVTGSPPVRRARAHTNDDRLLRKERGCTPLVKSMLIALFDSVYCSYVANYDDC